MVPSPKYAEADALHGAVQAFMDKARARAVAPVEFDALACAIARMQVAHSSGHARLWKRRGVDLASISRAEEIPAVPTDVFKQMRVSTFGDEDALCTFRTSGTTVGARGAHHFRRVDTYNAGALHAGRRALLGDWHEKVHVLVLGPSPAEVADSSLGHMNALFATQFGVPATPEETYFVREGDLCIDALCTRIDALHTQGVHRLLLLGTSFSYVHLLDALAGKGLPLPPEARVMQTGGYKGKSREVEADELRRSLATTFGISERAIVLEYGMTELSSQAWEMTAVDASAAPWILHPSPWQRITAVDPETLAPLPAGTEGIARIVDLANVESAVALQTQDRVLVGPDGSFRMLGRLPGATPRGCSIATDELLGTDPKPNSPPDIGS